MIRIVALIFFIYLCTSCNITNRDHHSSNEDIQEINAIMNVQQSAWNNGDLNEFMQAYWKNDSLKFIGKRGLTYGWQPTLDNYNLSYPDKAAMGRLQFTNISAESLDNTNVYVIGKWELFRASDTLAGHYSLLWKKLGGNWVIVADHSS